MDESSRAWGTEFVKLLFLVEELRMGFCGTLSFKAGFCGPDGLRSCVANPASFEEFGSIDAMAGVDQVRIQSRRESAAVTAPTSSRTTDAMASRSRGCAGRINQ